MELQMSTLSFRCRRLNLLRLFPLFIHKLM
uniref:Uncharacterized protein n=1 Tax=Arundo donax TaxID=35708 RepID=A0A0A9BZJ0_ARUDO